MQGYRKGQLQFALCQLINSRHKAAGGKADVAHPDIDTFRAGDNVQKVHHVVKIVQRLTNAHQDDMGNALPGILLRGINFRSNLAGGQVPHAARLGGGAKAAPHSAAHLCGYTYSVAVMVAHQNRFNAVAVRKLKQIFDRTVFGLLAAADGGHSQGAVLCKLGKQGFGLICHGRKIRSLLLVDPLKNLLGAESWLADGFNVIRQLGQRQVRQTVFFGFCLGFVLWLHMCLLHAVLSLQLLYTFSLIFE